MRRYTLNAWLYTFICTPAFPSTIYDYIRGYASRYVLVVIHIFFYIKGVGIHRSPYSGTRISPHMVTRVVIPLHVWLYIKCAVTHIYLYSSIPLYRICLYTWLYIMYVVIRIFLHYRRGYTPFSVLRNLYFTKCIFFFFFSYACL